MSENTRLDIDSNIPQEMDKIGKAADAAARKINNLGSGSALEELQRMMKSVEREFKNFGGSADNAFDKALKNLSKSSMPDSVRDVYRNALILAKEGRKELEAEYHKLGTASDEAARQVMAAEARLAKAVRNKKSQGPAKAELSAALAAQQEVEGKFALARMNAEKLKMFHLQLRDALNKEYNEFYLKRQATQKTADLAELQAFKDLGVKLIGEDAVLYKRLTESAKAAANLEKDQYQKKLESMASAQKEADTRFEAMRKDSLNRGKSLILQAAKDDAAALAAADKSAAAAELARYRQKLESMASAQKEADTRFEAMRKDSLNRGKSLILQAAKDDVAALAAALAAADKSAAAAELARYRQKLESMASAQKEADTRFEAMRKDSLNRGKSLILQAAKDDAAALAAADKSAAAAELARYRQKLESMASAQKEADTRFEAMRKDSLNRGKSLILQAAKDDAAALAAADKSAAAAELARYRQKLESMASAQKEADTRFEAMRKDSLNRGKSLILQAAKGELSAAKASGKALSDLAGKNQAFANSYNRVSAELAKGQTARAYTLLDNLKKIKAAAGNTAEMESAAVSKYGTAAVAAAKGKEIEGLQKQLEAVIIARKAEEAKTGKAGTLPNGEANAEATRKDQEFVNRYKNATKDLLAENKRRAESLVQYLTVVKAVAEKSKEYATAKYGTAAVAMATGSEFDVLNRSLTTTESKMPPLLQGFKALGGRLIDVHSATRGLASGFNLLWLTWGQMGPLFAGAAISMGTKSIVSMGAQIGHQLEIVRVLSEESDESVKGLNDQLMNIARTGPYGPLKVAEALKTLSLAGLDANQVTQALPRVLQFAAAGTTSIEKAAEVMTGVATSFGYTAENFNLVGDIVTKTAAVSKAGIEDMGEAFKAASVVSTQFGVSIKDVSLLLALQANLNIKNSAAGTNVRNMYTDLSGRSKESRKLMKALNLELTDSQGRFKDVVTIVKELDGALSKFSGKSARDAQLALISERGGKPIVAAFSAYKTEVREFAVVNGQMVETVTNQLEQLKKKTEDNYGFMALAAAKLSMTPLKQMESVVATFQTSLAQAFMGMEDEVLVTSARLKEVFNSPEFTSALKNLITGVASFTEVLLENLDVVGKVILGYVGFKILATTASMFLSLHSAVQASTTSLVAYRTAQAAAAGADTAAGIAASGAAAAAGRVGGNLLKAIPIVGTIISVGTAAWSMWELYNLTQGKTADVTKAAADGIKNSGMIEALDSENERLLKQVAILDLSLKLKRQVTEQEFNSMQKAEEAAANEAKRVGQVVARAKELEKEEAAFRQAEANLTAALFKSMGTEAKNSPAVVQLRKKAEEVARARSLLNTDPIKTELEYKVDRNGATSKVVSDLTEQLGKVLRDQKIPGIKIFDPDAVDQSAKSVVSSIEKQISAVVKGGNAQLNEAKSNYDLLRDLTEARHKAGVISEGEYQVELIKQTSVGEAAQIKAIADTEARLEPLYAEALSKYKKGSEEYAALDEKRIADYETLETKRVEIANAANKRQASAAIDHQGKLIKLQKEADKYLADLKGERLKEAAVAALNKQYENVNDSSVIWLQAEKAAAMAAAEAVGKHEAQLRESEKAYTDVAEAADKLGKASLDALLKGEDSSQLTVAWFQAEQQRIAQEKATAKIRKAINEDVANQSAIAYNEAFRKRANEFKNTLAQTLADALISGANDGGQNLRKILENELKAPFVLLFRMSIDALMGDLSSAVGSATGAGGTGSGGASSVLSSLGTASTLNTAYKALRGAIEGSIGKSFEKFALSDMGAKFGLSGTTTSSLSSASQEAFTAMQNANGIAGEFGSTLTTTSNQLTSLGSTFKTVGVNMAAAFAGQALRKGISGGYSVGGAGETLMDVGAMVASYFGPVASIITGAVSGLINRTFGRKLKDTGIQGTFAGSEFKGENYQYLKGGLLRSDKTKTSPMDSEAVNTFTNTFRSIQASTAVLATNMGLSAQSALDFKKDIKLSLKDLDPAAQSEAITKMFTEVQDEMATAVLDAWGDWSLIAKYGETASEVLTNVSNNLTGFNGMLDLLDLKLIDLTMNGAAAASAVIEAAGGVDALTGIYSSYYENFYSEAERNSKSIETLGEKFAALGVTMPALTKDAEGFVTNGDEAREVFRGLVSAVANTGNIALATELVKLSEAFAEVTPLAEKFLESLKDETKALNAEFLKAQGNLAGYAAAIRAIETVDMTAVEIATYDYNKQLEKYIELLGQADEARTTAGEAEIRLLEAQGNKTAALVKQRELDIKGLSEAQVAAYDYAAAIDRQIESMEKLSAAQDSIAASDIKLLQAQGNSALALAKQRELDIRSMTRAEVAAYDYSNAIDDQISKLEQAADIVSKLGNVSSDLSQYLKEFDSDTAGSFYKTIGEALSGDMEAMGRITSEADKAIESARGSSRTSTEFAARQAGILAKVRNVRDFASATAQETDTEKLLTAVKATTTAVDSLGTRLSSQDLAVSLNATLESIRKTAGAKADISAIKNLFAKLKATIAGMGLSYVASNEGQQILGMFESMRATVLSMTLNAPASEIEAVTNTFSAIAGTVTSIRTAEGVLPSTVSAITTALTGFQAVISDIAINSQDSNVRSLLLGTSSAMAYGLSLSAAVESGSGNFGMSAEQVKSLLDNSQIIRSLAVVAGTDGVLTTAQQQAYANASTEISKAISVVRGTDASNLTEAQKVLLGILGGSSNGQVSVGGAVDYEPSSELDNLFDNLTGALGRVGIEKMTGELGRLTAAIGQMLAKTESEKKLSDAQRAGSDIAARIADKSAQIKSDLDTIASLGSKYGYAVNRNLGDNPWQYVFDIVSQPDMTALSYGGAVTADPSKSNTTAFAKALLDANVGNSTVAKQAELEAAILQLESARNAVKALGGTPQFARGGYTGPGGINEFAGVVHKGEVVWSQSDITKAGGVDTVEAMRKGFMSYAQDIPAPAVVYNTTQSTITFDDSALLEELQSLREEVSNLRYESRATVVNTGNSNKLLKDFRDRGMTVKTDSDTPLAVTTQ